MMMTSPARATGKLRVHVSRLVPAPRERVFEAWIKPELRRQWWFSGRAVRVTACEIDARLGGRYLISQIGGGEEYDPSPNFEWVMQGEFLEFVPPQRLVFTWNVNHTPPVVNEVVTVEFREVTGGTEVTITHEGIESPQWRDGTEEGWTTLLEIQSRVLAED